jgi:tRNA threonylcarbamoyladenosine biosynthesis protein TsaB
MSQVVLSLDTSTPLLSAALVRQTADGRSILLASREDAPPVVTSTLVPSVFEELLAEASLRLDDVDVFATGLGPGLFTGVRVAVATMKALAYSRRKPLVGAESLEAMALRAVRPDGDIVSGALPTGPLLCAALDARKGEVYWALLRVVDGKLQNTLPPRATTQVVMAAALAEVNEPVLVFGTGVKGLAESALVRPVAEPRTPAAFEIAAIAMTRSPRPVFDAAAVLALEPFYLRPPEAEVARKKRELTSAPDGSH